VLEVGDPPLAHGLLPALVVLKHPLDIEEVLICQRGLCLGYVFEGDDAALGQ
jgi:hypothetical protein